MNRFTKTLKQNLVFYYFILAVFTAIFIFGVIVGKLKIFPYPILKNSYDVAKSFFGEDIAKLSKNCPVYLYPARHEGSGVVVHKAGKVFQGVTLMSGYWNNGNKWFIGIQLVDLTGKILHEWHVDRNELWSTLAYDDHGAVWDATRKKYIQGAILLPGGDVVFNLDYIGLYRLNAKSELIWKLPYRTHHSVFSDSQNKLWISGRKWRSESSSKYPNLIPPFVEETILRVSLDGKIEREISILESIYKSGYKGLLFVGGRTNSGDITHLNDVEVLDESKADAFESFNAGDIMVSLRNINTVLVIDKDTEMVKWSVTHPFIRQHDPDFTDDGFITIFDNNDDGTLDGSVFGGSRILRINPSSKEVSIIYPKKKNGNFYSQTSGKHQHLPNGNLLITESNFGRVFEITPAGEIVWSFIGSRVGRKKIPEILDSVRYNSKLANF